MLIIQAKIEWKTRMNRLFDLVNSYHIFLEKNFYEKLEYNVAKLG